VAAPVEPSRGRRGAAFVRPQAIESPRVLRHRPV